jgi:hypothetical protein
MDSRILLFGQPADAAFMRPRRVTEKDHEERAHPAPSGALARGGVRTFRHRPAGRNDPRSVARRPLPRLRHRTGRGVLRQLKRPAAPECASRTPCSAAPSPPAGGLPARPSTGKSPRLTSGPTFVTLRLWKRTLSASDSGPTPLRAKSDFSLDALYGSVHVGGKGVKGDLFVYPDERNAGWQACDSR